MSKNLIVAVGTNTQGSGNYPLFIAHAQLQLLSYVKFGSGWYIEMSILFEMNMLVRERSYEG